MKLKNQFLIFIIATTLMPFFCLAGILCHNYLTDPERTLLHNFNNVRSIESNRLSSDDWEKLQNMLKKQPPHTETAVAINGRILFSNMSDLKTGELITGRDMFKRMEQNSKNYFYQFVPTTLETNGEKAAIITKVPRKDSTRRRMGNKFLLNILFILGFFAFVTICFIIQISTTISRSISILEKNTERIANGELDIELKTSKHRFSKNEITSLTENLEKMRQSLKENEERRTRFIMGISHDLRTPVEVIKGYTEALSDGTAADPQMVKNALEIIGTKTNQLESMIETLINYVKLNSRAWREQLVSQPIEGALKEFSHTAVTTGNVFKRNISTSIEIDKKLCIPFSRQLLERTLENLLTNAIRYSHDGDSIDITAIQNEQNIIISIADTGIGISKDDKQHIFDLFYKASNSRQEGGMGIGLSVVKNIIDAHGWKITVDDNKQADNGTVFSIIIPLNQADIQENSSKQGFHQM